MVYVERNMGDITGTDPRVIRSALVARGKNIYQQFAPDGQYHEPDAGVEDIIIEAARGSYGPQYALDPYGVAVQMSEETAACQSHYWLTRANPGGVGAEDGTDNAIDFTKNPDGSTRSRADAMRAGIGAMADHLRSYHFGQGPWVQHDPRAKKMPAAWFGSVATWAGLQGKWATSPTYAQSMEGIWAQLMRIAGEAPSAPPAAGTGRVPKPPVVTKYRSPNRDYSTPFKGMGVICHIATSNLSSNISWFMNPAADASSNFETAKDGTIIEFVEYPHSAYAHGVVNHPDTSHPLIKAIMAEGVNPNTRARSIEHEGEAGDRLTAAQIASTAWLIAWIAQEDGFPIDADHITGHFRIDSVNRPYCPSFDPDEWQAIIGGAQALRDHYTGGPMTDDTVRTFKDVGLPWELRGGFKAAWEYWEQCGVNLVTAGFPRSNQFDVNPPEKPVPGLPWRLAGIARAVKMDRGGYMVEEPAEGAPYNFRLAADDQIPLLDELFARLFPDVQAA